MTLERTCSTLQFIVHVEARRGATPEELSRFEDALAAYADRHGLVLDARMGAILVTACEGDVTVTDQVQLLDWLFDQSAVGTVHLGPITQGFSSMAQRQAVLVAVRRLDILVIGVSLLYRSRNLAPQLYLQVLLEAARPVALH